jgi:integrase
MPSLFRRSNGYYYLVSFVNGRRIWKSTGCRTSSEALKYLADQKRKVKTPPPITLSQFTPQILSALSTNLAPGTVELYRSALRVFEQKVGDHPLVAYTPQMVEEFKRQRLTEVSAVKVNIDFRTLRASFNVACTWGLLVENPFRKCKQIRVADRRPAYLSTEEFAQLLKVVPTDWFRDLLRFAVATMMRLGEIVNLKWSSVNLERRIVLVENVGEFRTKTRKMRAIPLNELVHLVLRNKTRQGDRVFVFPDGRPLSVGYVSRTFKKYVRKAHLSEEIHFHSLRHTGATWLVQRDVPIYSIQQLLGHSRVDMTQIYSHLDVEHLRRPLDRMAEMLSST